MNIQLHKTSLVYFSLWCLIFILGNIKWADNIPAIQFFTVRLGVMSLFVLIVQWWSGTGEIAKTSKSILMTMSIYGIKMFACAVIFIYYFHFNKEDKEIAVFSGFTIFFFYSLVEVTYGLKLTKEN